VNLGEGVLTLFLNSAASIDFLLEPLQAGNVASISESVHGSLLCKRGKNFFSILQDVSPEEPSSIAAALPDFSLAPRECSSRFFSRMITVMLRMRDCRIVFLLMHSLEAGYCASP
jgi:hypothetical protein